MATSRAGLIERVRAGETWDLVVIGGGATGLGTAVDAASRGYRTLLLEAHDFAKATSSRSTKLIHGGVRYLAQARIGLVREALHERGVLRKNAPHLVHDLAFAVPSYTWWGRPYYGLGLKVYDLLAGSLAIAPSRLISPAETLERLPTLRSRGLRGAVLYFDGQFDDSRLAVALLRTALDLGAVALNYVAVTALDKQGGKVTGVRARDSETDEEFTIRARGVVNATGVFTDAIRLLDDPGAAPVVAPSQGIHLVLNRDFLPGTTALMIPRTDDGRVLFVIPWHDRVLLGTTDTPVPRAEIEPRPFDDEVAYLLEHAARYLTRPPLISDVRARFAGLRPLVRARDATKTSQLSREHHLGVSASGLVTITGGKWTTYRRMAVEIVDCAAKVAELPQRASVTESRRLHGWISEANSGPLAHYGSDAPALARLCAERPEWERPLHPALPYRAGEVIWGARHEAARTVEDILARRTRMLFLDARAGIEAAPAVAALLSAELGFDAGWQTGQVERFVALARGYC